MDYFVEFARLKRAKKVPYMALREFVHPDGLLLPPKQISENQYDYGNVFYNKLLNTPAGKPAILFSFLPKPGSKSSAANANANVDDHLYKQYLQALASIIGNIVKFTTF